MAAVAVNRRFMESVAAVAPAFLMAYKHVHTQTLNILMNSIRWNIVVSPNTDQSVRMYLAGQGGGRKGDLSRFIEEAVRAHILELSAEQAKAANVNVSEADLTAIVAEAVQWAREH
jgi:post-segregation antitoxin (ccd killing protein)